MRLVHPRRILPRPLARLLVLREVPELRDVVENGLEVVIANLAFERGYERARLFGCVAAECACVKRTSVHGLTCPNTHALDP